MSSAPPGQTPAREKRKKLRTALSSFYGLESQPRASSVAASTFASPSSTHFDPADESLDIDSQSFDVTKYTTHLLKENNLKGLLATDKQLRKDVRELDGELQQLVYENYSKFITATDTIRQMRVNVSQMDDKLNSLTTNLESIDKLTDAISGTLGKHRTQIEERLNVSRTLKKIQFLVDLPQKMKAAMKKEEWGAAAKYYVVGDAVLLKHRSVKSFELIHADCCEVAMDLYNKLCTLVSETPLEHQNVPAVRKYVESIRELRATTLFHTPGATDEEEDDTVSATDQLVIDLLMRRSIEDFNNHMTTVRTAIKKEMQDRCVTTDKRIQDRDGLFAHRKQQNVELVETLRGACSQLYNELELALELSLTESSSMLGRLVAKCVRPAVAEVIELMVDGTREGAMATKDIAISYLCDLPNIKKAEVRNVWKDFVGQLVQDLKDIATPCRALANEFLVKKGAFDFSDDIGTLLDKTISGLLHHFRNYFSSIASGNVNDALSVVGPKAAHKGVAVVGALAETLCKLGVRRLTSEVIPGDQAAKHLVQELDGAVMQVATQYYKLMNRRVTAALRAGIEGGNWGDKKEPFHAGGMVKMLAEEWVGVHVVVAACFPEEKDSRLSSGVSTISRESSDASSKGPASSAGRSSSSHYRLTSVTLSHLRPDHHNLTSDVDRLLSGSHTQGTSFSTVPRRLNPQHITECVILASLKSFIELIRCTTFNKGGFQQMQVDLSYLLLFVQQHASYFRNPERAVPFLNESLQCAYERCVQRIPLPKSAINALLQEHDQDE